MSQSALKQTVELPSPLAREGSSVMPLRHSAKVRLAIGDLSRVDPSICQALYHYNTSPTPSAAKQFARDIIDSPLGRAFSLLMTAAHSVTPDDARTEYVDMALDALGAAR